MLPRFIRGQQSFDDQLCFTISFIHTGNGDHDHPRVGCWGGGFEDDPVLSDKGVRGTLGKERGCPAGARPLTPSPTRHVAAWFQLASDGLTKHPPSLRRAHREILYTATTEL